MSKQPPPPKWDKPRTIVNALFTGGAFSYWSVADPSPIMSIDLYESKDALAIVQTETDGSKVVTMVGSMLEFKPWYKMPPWRWPVLVYYALKRRTKALWARVTGRVFYDVGNR